ncbi:MAG: hypothetical protein PHF53_02860, partial [Bacteroidales bacterium]|nr:hypothetical protein [Bacteroidales bacterium]
MKNRALKIILAILVLIILVFLAGPRMPKATYDSAMPSIDVPVSAVASYIDSLENLVPAIRPDNEAQVVYACDTAP